MTQDGRRAGSSAKLSTGRQLLFLVVPWLFLCVLGLAAWRLVIPALLGGAAYGYVLAAVFLLVGSSFATAAVTMSRDVLTGRYP